MLRHYLRTSFRNLRHQRLYTLINLLGLATGAAVTILMFLYVRNEWSFDRFHEGSDRIYRAWVREHLDGEAGTALDQPGRRATLRIGRLERFGLQYSVFSRK